jgi:hypothetical protein
MLSRPIRTAGTPLPAGIDRRARNPRRFVGNIVGLLVSALIEDVSGPAKKATLPDDHGDGKRQQILG